MTHAELVNRAATWLQTTLKCSVVLAEMSCASDIIPDAIGWRTSSMWSILVECKMSRSDFRADFAKRIHTDPDNAPGQERWYLTPPGLIRPNEVPAGWFLAEAGDKGIRKIVAPTYNDFQGRPPRVHGRVVAEMPYLLSAMRRCTLGVPFDSARGRFETFAEREALRAKVAA